MLYTPEIFFSLRTLFRNRKVIIGLKKIVLTVNPQFFLELLIFNKQFCMFIYFVLIIFFRLSSLLDFFCKSDITLG